MLVVGTVLDHESPGQEHLKRISRMVFYKSFQRVVNCGMMFLAYSILPWGISS